MTFYHYVEQQLGSRFTIESPFEQIEVVFSESESDSWSRLSGMRYKSSEHFLNRVDAYLTDLMKEGLQFRNIRFRDQFIFTKEQLAETFYQFPEHVSIQLRLEKLAELILKRLNQLERKWIKADWVEDEVELLDKDDLQEIFTKVENEVQENREGYHEADAESYYLKQKVVRRRLAPLRRKIKQLAFVNTKRTYMKLFDQVEPGEGITKKNG